MPATQTISCGRLNESCKIASVISGKLPSVQGEESSASARKRADSEEVRRKIEGWGGKMMFVKHRQWVSVGRSRLDKAQTVGPLMSSAAHIHD